MRFLFIIVSLLLSWHVLADDTFAYIIGKHGYDAATANDLSASANIKLAEPACAYVNITGISQMPTEKNQDLHAWMECYDGSGNYFKKRVVLNAQGQSSMYHPKKNISVELYETAWGSGKTTDITFGEWVKQDEFHLKAYYTDFFRGCSKIAYDIYDDITSDREKPLPWQRAGVATASPNARCHPNGFPCYVYLGGNFYGLYVWSLRKNHKNMGQAKDNAKHIHIDGYIGYDEIFNGKINWTKFDVRTPKRLYCVETEEPQTGGTPSYKVYDGDHPTELIDESMPYYDMNNEGHVVTNEVKKSLVNLSNYYALLKEAEENVNYDAEAFRTEYEKLFDVQGQIDYYIHSFVTNNYDGHWKNWQWFTYDGIKWYMAPYDLDCTFGHHSTGNLLFPPEWKNHLGVRYNEIQAKGSLELFIKYYFDDLKERYVTLRRKKIIDAKRYISYFTTWAERIGAEGYEIERAKWPNSPCFRETIVNPNWETEDNWENYNLYPAYSPDVTYHAGDKCRDSYRIWTATATTQGIRPFARLGQTDSLERVAEWITERINLLDGFLGYNSDADDVQEIASGNQEGTRLVIKDGKTYVVRNGEVFLVDGRRVK